MSVPILGDKKSPRSRDNKGTFKKTKKMKCPGVSANSGRRKSGTRAEKPRRNPTIFCVARFAPARLRFASGLATTRRSVRTLLSRARPQDYGRMPNANSLKLVVIDRIAIIIAREFVYTCFVFLAILKYI